MTDDPSERFRRLGRLFDQFVDLTAAEREAAIENAAWGDAELERELRALLAADESGRSDAALSAVVSSEARAMEILAGGCSRGRWPGQAEFATLPGCGHTSF